MKYDSREELKNVKYLRVWLFNILKILEYCYNSFVV